MAHELLTCWKNGQLPSKDALFFADGRSYELSLNWSEFKLDGLSVGKEFSSDKYIANQKNMLTHVYPWHEVKIGNDFVCFGECAWGEAGVIAKLNPNKEFEWVMYFNNSNPFQSCEVMDNGAIEVESTAFFRILIDINNPLKATVRYLGKPRISFTS